MTYSEKKETPHEIRIKISEEEIDLFKKHNVKNILEVCSGDGRNLIKLKRMGFEVVGIETPLFINEDFTKNENITVISHNVFDENFPFDNEFFDCVYSYQYINHNYKEKIEDLFKEIYRILKKGGLFSIKISDMDQFNLKHIKDNLYEELDIEEGFTTKQFKKLAEQTFMKLDGEEKGIPHYAFYKAELIASLEKVGFKLLNIKISKWNLLGNFIK